jgi:NAD(P)-dependent dehydrogenase (short-subunit alcohol dehydrogenase family)
VTITRMTDITGASILVVGATGGLGREISSLLSQRGASLTLAARDEGRLAAVRIPGTVVAGDVTRPGIPAHFVSSAVAAYGKLDGVIFAAGAVAFGSVTELSDEVIERLWQVNARAWMSLLREATPALTASAVAGGSPFALTLSGVVAEAPTAGIAAYSAVKSALHSYGVAAGRELRRAGIRMVDARPGHTETELSLHPLAGSAPAFAAGLAPAAVAARLVEAIAADEKDLPSSSF